jgi:peptidoglycan-N-acetylglucosamine deacetylase
VWSKRVARTVLSGTAVAALAMSGSASAATVTSGGVAGRARPATMTRAAATAGCPAVPYGAHFHAPGRSKTVALTFDDGPGRSTAAILSVLARYRVPATFFNIGQNMSARRSLLRAEVSRGYATGNHSWNHPVLVRLSASRQAAQLDRASFEQRVITRTWPCAFRPPYGDYNATTLRLASRRHLEVWLWSVDTQDWMADGSGSSYWVHRIIGLAEREGRVQRHPIVLMHNQPAGNPATVRALPTIIQYFRAHGYRFVVL